MKESPREAPERPTSFQHLKKSVVFLPSEASRWLQDGPRGLQERPQRGPRAPQERTKSAPRGSQEVNVRAPTGGLKLKPPSFDGWPPRWPQEGPKRAPRAPRRAPREPQESPRGFQHVPKRALRWPQEAYKTLPERKIAKALILTIVVVVVFALFFLVVVPFALPCSSRKHRPTTPDSRCALQRWLFWDGLVGTREA